MVLSSVWILPWITTSLSIIVLIVITTILLYCVCWKRRKSLPQFYIIDENGLRKSSITDYARNSLNNLKFYRRTTSIENKNENIFTSKNLPFFKVSNKEATDSDLQESTDDLKSFENGSLQLVDNMSQNSGKEELCSCLSTDSWYTFYSVRPPASIRSNSRATFVSVELNTDTEALID